MENPYFHISPLKSNETETCEKAIELFHKTGGNTDIQSEQLRASINHPMCFVVGAFINDKLVGIATAYMLQAKHLDYYNQFLPEFSVIYSQTTNGQIHSVAVDPEFQGIGIGSSLLKARLEWLKDKGVQYAFAVSWDNGQENSSKHVFNKFQFDIVQTIPDFYREASLSLGKACPVCGPSCHCSGILYRKKL